MLLGVSGMGMFTMPRLVDHWNDATIKVRVRHTFENMENRLPH